MGGFTQPNNQLFPQYCLFNQSQCWFQDEEEKRLRMEILQGSSKNKNSKDGAGTKPDAEEGKGKQRPQRPKPEATETAIGQGGDSIENILAWVLA